jgi:hypothetical protein
MSAVAWPLASLLIAGLAYHAITKFMQLAHGRLLAGDRAQAIDRQVTALELKSKRRDSEMNDVMTQMEQHAIAIKGAERDIDVLRKDFGEVGASLIRIDARSENTTANVARFINESREQIEGLKQRETMALAGLNVIGRKGLKATP